MIYPMQVSETGTTISTEREDLVEVVRGFAEAYPKHDVEKILSFLAEEVIWIAPEGTFRGKDEVRRFLSWMPTSFWWREMKFSDAGIGIAVEGNRAVYEYTINGVGETMMEYRIPAISVFEFAEDASCKILRHRTYYDRMSIGKQACKGFLDHKIIVGILNTWEKGLR